MESQTGRTHIRFFKNRRKVHWHSVHLHWRDERDDVTVSCFQVMTRREQEIITDLKKCKFDEILHYFKAQSEAR